MIQLGSAYGEIQIGTRDAERNVSTLAGSLRRVGTAMSLAVSAPLMAVGAAGLKAAAGFEQSMAQVQVVSDATAAQMGQLQAVALQLGRDTSFSAGEAAQGLLELAKAGMSADESMAAIGGVLDLAAAGGLSVASAAEIASNALNSFNLPASEAGRVADLLAAAANSSSIEVTDMAQAFAMSSSVFASNSQSIEDLSTAIAILGNNGLKGSDAGTSLKTMLMRLTAPTGEAAEAMSALGIQVYNADGSMRSFQDVVGQLETATAGLTQEQRNQALATIFGADAIRAANILIKEGAGEFDNMKASVEQAGAAQLVADAKMRGLAGAIAYARGTIESSLIKAFLPLTQTIGDLIRGAADLIGRFGDLPEPVRNAALAFGAVLAIAGPLLVALPMIAGALGALLSPIGLVVLAVAGLAAAWTADFGGIREKTAEVVDALQPMLERLSGYLDLIKAGDWSGLTNAVFADVGSVLSQASAKISAFDWADWIAGVLDWASYIGTLAWDGFLTLLDWQLYIWKLEWSTFVSVLTWGSEYISALPWADYVTALGEWSAYVGELAWDGFVSALTWGAEYIQSLDWAGFVTALGEWSAYVGELAWDGFVSALTWGAEYIQSLDWAGFVTALGEWSAYVGELAWDGFVSALTWGAEYIQSLDWAGFVATLSDWGQWISSLDWTKIITTFIDWATWIPALTWNTFVAMLDWATIVVAFAWTEWISKLSWADFVAALSWGSDQVSTLEWADFVAALDWVGYVAGFAWDSFVSKLEWPLIAQFDWASWIASFKWPSLPSFSWSSWISPFRWPSLPSFSWSNFISSFNWPSIPEFKWPTINIPKIPGFATGTAFAPRGMTLVGERGPELVEMPQGARVYTADQTRRMGAGAGGQGDIVINLGGVTVASGMDVEELAWRLAGKIRARVG